MLGLAQTLTIGELSQRVELQRRSDVPDDATGGLVESYTPIATVWAKVEAVAGSLYFASQQVEEGTTHAITIRDRADWQLIEYVQLPVPPSPGRRFRVQRIRDLGGNPNFFEMLCEEIKDV